MSRLIFVALVSAFLLHACQPSPNPEAELREIIDQLQADQQHAYLRTLAPAYEDCLAIFIDSAAARRVSAFSEGRFADIEQVPEGSMKGSGNDGSVHILSATRAELLAGQSHGLTEEYFDLAPYLAEGTVVYGLRFVNTEGEEVKSRAAFFRTPDRWFFIPRPALAFIGE
jgi:hypothetical protein